MVALVELHQLMQQLTVKGKLLLSQIVEHSLKPATPLLAGILKPMVMALTI